MYFSSKITFVNLSVKLKIVTHQGGHIVHMPNYTPGVLSRCIENSWYTGYYNFILENDLSAENEDIVEDMLLRLAEYQAASVFPRFPFPDPSSNPQNRGGAWTPWLD